MVREVILRFFEAITNPALHLYFLYVAVYVHDMLHVILHNLLCDFLVVRLRRIPNLFCSLIFLLSDCCIGRFHHVRRLHVLLNRGQLGSRLVL